MTVVADASVVVPALVDAGRSGAAARAALRDEDVVVPALLDVEVLQALRGRVQGGKLGAEPAARAAADLARFPALRLGHGPLLGRIWELRANLTAYDAAYVALAETLGAVVVTADLGLAAASGPRCEFQVLS